MAGEQVAEENEHQGVNSEAAAGSAAAAAPIPGEASTGEPEMEIHKPKPVHSWREFLTEISIVVLGVIIAIGLEQTVEWLHWQSEVKVARQAIRTEIEANNVNLFAARIGIASCVQRQIGDVDAILTALAAGQKPGQLSTFKTVAGSPIRTTEWESERASQVLTHFPRAELAVMSRYYAQLPDFTAWNRDENAAWNELAILQNPPSGLTASDLIRLRADLAVAKYAEYLLVSNARRELRVANQLGIADPATDEVRVKNFCTMSSDDFLRYREAQDFR